MKTFRLSLLAICMLACNFLFSQNTNILQLPTSVNTDGAAPDASAILDVQSTTQGMLVPRMTTAQRSAVATPATGLLVFDTDTGGFWFYNGSAWTNLSAGGGTPTSIADADGDTKIQVEENPDEDIIRMDLGGDEVLFLKKNNPTGNHLMIDLPDNDENTFLGHNAGRDNETGSINTFIGNGSGENIESGINNTFLGAFSGLNTTGGSENVFIGANTGRNHENQGGNTFIGSAAGASNLTGSGNVFLGKEAGEFETGSEKLYIDNSNTASPLIYGEFNNDLLRINGTLNVNNAYSFPNADGTTGQVLSTNGAGLANWTGLPTPTLLQDADGNTKIQVEEGTNDDIIRMDLAGSERIIIRKNNTTDNGTMIELPSNSSNVFIGNNAGVDNTTGFENVFLGNNAGNDNTEGARNVFIGHNTGGQITTGGSNTFIGEASGRVNQEGSNNTYLGKDAGALGATGSDNVYLGHKSGNLATGSGNVFIGNRSGETASGSNKLYIDNSGTSTPLIWGDFSANRMGVNRVATTNTLEVGGNASKATAGDWLANSDARLKANIRPLNSEEILRKMLSLQGVTYEWDDDQTGSERPEGTQYGFTAQNIQQVFPELVTEDNLGFLQTAYGTYDAMTVEAIRALNDKIAQQESEIENLQSQLTEMDELKNRMAKLEAALNSDTAQKD